VQGCDTSTTFRVGSCCCHRCCHRYHALPGARLAASQATTRCRHACLHVANALPSAANACCVCSPCRAASLPDKLTFNLCDGLEAVKVHATNANVLHALHEPLLACDRSLTHPRHKPWKVGQECAKMRAHMQTRMQRRTAGSSSCVNPGHDHTWLIETRRARPPHCSRTDRHSCQRSKRVCHKRRCPRAMMPRSRQKHPQCSAAVSVE
jgi:hypothetical protein